MNTQHGIQQAFPWQEGPVPLQPVDNQPERCPCGAKLNWLHFPDCSEPGFFRGTR